MSQQPRHKSKSVDGRVQFSSVPSPDAWREGSVVSGFGDRGDAQHAYAYGADEETGKTVWHGRHHAIRFHLKSRASDGGQLEWGEEARRTGRATASLLADADVVGLHGVAVDH